MPWIDSYYTQYSVIFFLRSVFFLPRNKLPNLDFASTATSSGITEESKSYPESNMVLFSFSILLVRVSGSFLLET